MKAWSKIVKAAFFILLLVMISTNVYMISNRQDNIPNETIVEINRLYQQLQEGKEIKDLKLDNIAIKLFHEDAFQMEQYMYDASKRVMVLPAKQKDMFYAFTYQAERYPITFLYFVNFAFFICILLLLLMVLFIRKQIIQPFHSMEEVAIALKNRDFQYQLPAQKQKLFGKFIWAIDMMREELRYHEQKEIELMKEKKLMILSLSHDIKTPLSNIRLYNEASNQTIYPKETIYQRIEENCEKIDRYIKEIMSANQEELFHFEVEMKEIYLHEIFDMLQQEKERVQLAMIQYHVEPYQDMILKTDIYRLKEVINNVVDNAIKYGDHESIFVRFYEEEHHLILQITNTGKPIQPQDVNSIFQSFYRGNNTNTQQGHGLGLYICKELMKKMEGDIFMSQSATIVSFHIVIGAI